MQNFLGLGLNAGAQITHGGQVQRPRYANSYLRQLKYIKRLYSSFLVNQESRASWKKNEVNEDVLITVIPLQIWLQYR